MFTKLNKQNMMRSVLFAAACVASTSVFADGGISIQGTRIIYPQNAEQVSVALNNSSKTDMYLIQSWTEDAQGHKSHDFAVTPPLFVSHAGDENILRLMYTGHQLPQDRESLYYFIEKAIPSVEKNKAKDENVLMMAAANRIKLFVRPAGLTPSVTEAPTKLRFHRAGSTLQIDNPTPYYITLTDMKAGSAVLKDIMVPPRGNISEALPSGSGTTVTFHTINDYGAITKAQTASMQ